MEKEIEIRECVTLDQLADCVELQREVFALPDIEISPVRHLIVTKNAGGFILGAYDRDRMVGFVLSVPAFRGAERAFYSHMTAVHGEYQSLGIGARLKWAQRGHALSTGVQFIKWTFEPVKARNAYFNLEKLGAIVSEYRENFYGTDYTTTASTENRIGLASDRLFAEWHLESPKVEALATGVEFDQPGDRAAAVRIMSNWPAMVESDANAALAEQVRIRGEFQSAFSRGLIGRGFDRERSAYLLYKD